MNKFYWYVLGVCKDRNILFAQLCEMVNLPIVPLYSCANKMAVFTTATSKQ